MSHTRPSLAFIVILSLVGCGPVSSEVKTQSAKRIRVTETSREMQIKVIVLDGNEYYATPTHAGYWTLCPKLPPKP
jgi:hypothetical protein